MHRLSAWNLLEKNLRRNVSVMIWCGSILCRSRLYRSHCSSYGCGKCGILWRIIQHWSICNRVIIWTVYSLKKWIQHWFREPRWWCNGDRQISITRHQRRNSIPCMLWKFDDANNYHKYCFPLPHGQGPMPDFGWQVLWTSNLWDRTQDTLLEMLESQHVRLELIMDLPHVTHDDETKFYQSFPTSWSDPAGTRSLSVTSSWRGSPATRTSWGEPRLGSAPCIALGNGIES